MSPRRPSSGRALVAGILLLTVGPAGCATVPPRQPIAPDALAALALIERRWQAFGDLRTLADIAIRRDGRLQHLSGVLLLRAPASLRFDTLTPFGLPVLVVTADTETVTIWEILKSRAVLLPASPDANRRWLGVALGAADLTALLSGHVLTLRDPLTAELLPADAVGQSLRLAGAEQTQRVWFDPASGRVIQAEWRGGKVPARVVFAGGGPAEPPTGLTLATLDGALEVVVRYRRLELDSGFDPGLLRVTVPQHVKIQDFR